MALEKRPYGRHITDLYAEVMQMEGFGEAMLASVF